MFQTSNLNDRKCNLAFKIYLNQIKAMWFGLDRFFSRQYNFFVSNIKTRLKRNIFSTMF